ncbi:MAG: hypothetical protein MK209_06630 [Planctomycetes bacterium]|nr:hypothetical protein [Planctomycetota bacterium]
MLAFFAGLFVVASLLAIGESLLPPTRQCVRSRWESFGLAYLVGTAAVVVTGTAVLAFGLPFVAVAGAMLALGLFAILHILRRSARAELTSELELTRKPGFPPLLGSLVLSLGLGSVLATMALPLNEFDPMLHFAYKGKILAELGSPFDEAMVALVDENDRPLEFGRIVTHPNYPLGIPILEALVAVLGRGWHERWIQLPLAFWALCLPAAVFFGLRPIGKRAARSGALVAAATPIVYERNFLENGLRDFHEAGLGNEMTIGAGADLPVAALFAGACALVLHGRRNGQGRLQLLGALCLAGAAMMKNEGLALFGCALLAWLLAGAALPIGRQAREGKGTLAAIALGIAAILPWLRLRSRLPAIDENYADHFTLGNILHFLGGGAELVERSPKALVGQADNMLANPPARMDALPSYFTSEFTDWRSWGLMWLLLLVALPWRPRELRDVDRRWLTMLALGGVLLYFLILLVTPWYLPLLREKGIPERLLLHLVGPFCLLIGWRLGEKSETDKGPARSKEIPQSG